ncbi:signal transduction histidine-protein kinase/phosphatase UhpB [Vibrio sp. V27_P1S3P104]|uniref:signal transduction histidine-protein kinase/phosphatase UhpB n=1 Tax=unclassified Vibrio TaxID=2614977 RepID=UPI001372CBF3|nr:MULTISPECIES: signal transduction histidine-protein kinase/phosphatase UhpB [unclassified Vibrio]NAW69729.1 signal transduction histidine-protein kinase/phosphatase UhpB [Vibrio sp. V28_P6S34P95]NAX06294.1 signal transduction histidine-protein kinase/phosphatase UhpB [Vibrio sp. V30_P3S12P165]NAX34893.1 signal transduction histidine-protein kinase/phosphatase UhpB [Vibrio sp. V29_P1S30P107]NAX37911.1 signal transduction histidine-protein kinase/phosphatase UhpB [Vibrio sp. V27_P1S3P104]NAX4
MRLHPFTALCSMMVTACAWFCLWVIGVYFVNDSELAILFFPFALRLGITLHCAPRYWLIIYLTEWTLTISLALLLAQPQWLTILIASVLSLPITAVAYHYYTGEQWRRLMVMGTLITLSATLNAASVSLHVPSIYLTWLVSLTGGLMVVPTCYLLWNYLFQTHWIPLSVQLIRRTPRFNIKAISLCSLLFFISIILQTSLPEELRRFAPFCLAIPIILLALRYGWQGALLATLLNSIALIAARSDVTNLEITDLLLSISAQSLTGLFLGVAVQRQQDLNSQLRQELRRNQSLSQQLVKAEESVRKEVARELHDEIGQSITAIRTQASIIKRAEQTQIKEACAHTIEQLSLNVYDTTKRLLSKLRPRSLDDLRLLEAIQQLIREMEFARNGIQVNLTVQGKVETLSDTLQVTLFRLCQEALNNARKYAQANNIDISLVVAEKITLCIEDDGIGFSQIDSLQGMGLKGMKERVQALGGRFSLQSQSSSPSGTQLYAQLPIV